MDDRSYGVIVSVDNLDKARTFYQEVIGLGTPVVDSNHWTEFQMPNGLILGLRSQPKADEKKNPCMLWVYFTDKYAEVKDRLKKAGSDALKVPAPPIGMKAEIFADPEGNRFILAMKPQ